MPSRYTSYSTNLFDCADDDLVIIPVEETDEEIVSGIDALLTDDEAVIEHAGADRAEVVISLNLAGEDVIPVKRTSGAASDWSIRLPKLVKSLKNKRPVSIYRDAAFMLDLQALLALHDAGTLDPSSVSRLPHLLHPLDKTIFDRSSKHPPWWLLVNGGEPLAKPVRQFKSPAAWREVSDTLHIHYLHLGLKALGPVHGFTLRLSHAVEAQARAQPDAHAWLTARIGRRLKDLLGRPVQFYCVLEEDDAGRLHLHGEFNIVGHNEVQVDRVRVKVRKALRRAGGEWPKASKARQRQAQVKAEAPDAGWSGYLAKDFAFFGPITREMLTTYGSSYAPGFKGGQVSRTKLLGEVAGKIYGEHRALVMGSD